MKNCVIYIHGKGGSAKEAEHYNSLFPDCDILGFGYRTSTPWETGAEIHGELERLSKTYGNIILVCNSIGAFFTMSSGIGNPGNPLHAKISKAFFISPIVNMEKLICDMMVWAGVTERELEEKSTVETTFGETLSWEYLTYVREHPIRWNIPTKILYGSMDNLVNLETMKNFVESHKAELTIMENGEHWFHTEQQMKFLDSWIAHAQSLPEVQ